MELFLRKISQLPFQKILIELFCVLKEFTHGVECYTNKLTNDKIYSSTYYDSL